MDKTSLLDLIGRREKKLREARRFRKRLLATDPRPESLWPALQYARRFVQPKGDGQTLIEGGLDSQFLDVNESDMSAGFVISAVSRDRHGDVVVPEGCKETLEYYAKNPQIFFAHESNGEPIALAENKAGKFQFEIREKDILSRAFFHGRTEESDRIFDLVANRILRAASIGFFPVYGEVIPGSDYEEGDAEIDFDMGGIYFSKWSIVEWSVVSVPANPDALRGWLSKTNVKSHSLKKNLEPFATPLKRNQVIGGFAAMKSDKPKKPFKVQEQKLRPASVEIDFASKHIGCPVKHMVERYVRVPAAKMGGFLCGWRTAAAAFEEVDVRSITYDGREMPPIRETIRLDSEKTDDFLIDGIVFYEGQDTKFVLSIQPTFFGLQLRFFTKKDESAIVTDLVDKAWELARTEYNFLKGEAFSLSGNFIPKTKETFDDIFLSDKNAASIKASLKLLNAKGKNFTNRGAVWMGPPGTGKTLSARVIRNQAKATYIWISARDFYNYGSFGGFSYAFELAKELAPTVLVFEDIDNWMSDYSIDFLKTEMDGVGRSAGIWTILTTNFPQRLPEALLDRPGRFHDVLKFDKPDKTLRRRMLAKWLPDLPADELDQAAKNTQGYSGAHLYELCFFAKTLCEQDDVPLAKALEAALAKIAEQRDLIDRTLRGEKQLRISHTKQLVLPFRYRRGRTVKRPLLATSL